MTFALLTDEGYLTWEDGEVSGTPSWAVSEAEDALRERQWAGATPTGPWFERGTPEHAYLVLRSLEPQAEVGGEPPTLGDYGPELPDQEGEPMQEAYVETLHPRGRTGEWIDKPDFAALDRQIARDFAPWDVPAPEGVEFSNLEGDLGAGLRKQMQEHVDDYHLIPEPVRRKLIDYGATWMIGKGAVPDLDDYSDMATEKPRGWGGGNTFKRVAGMFDQFKKRIVVGSGRHGAVSILLHETGHAITQMLGLAQGPWWSESDPPTWGNHGELAQHHKRLYRKLPAYAKQRSKGKAGNADGQDELFAMTFERLLKQGREAAVEFTDDEFVSWMEDKLK